MSDKGEKHQYWWQDPRSSYQSSPIMPGYRPRIGGPAPIMVDDGWKARMGPLYELLAKQSRGEGSVVDEQTRQAMQRAAAQGSSIAAGARPGQAGLAARLGAQTSSQAMGGLAGQGMMAKLAEQQQSQRALADYLLGARGLEEQEAARLQRLQEIEAQKPGLFDKLLGVGGGIAQAYYLGPKEPKK